MEEIEKNIVLLCQEKDIGAFSKMYEFYKDKIYNLCLCMIKNQQDAEDIMQDIFLSIWKNIEKFSFQSKFSSWIYQIAINRCIDRERKNKRVQIYPLSEIKTEEKSPEEIFHQKEIKQILRNAVNKLNPKFRAYIILRDKEGFSYEEISRILKVSLSVVKINIHRAREQLAKELEILRKEG